jgi:hypothetical protein
MIFALKVLTVVCVAVAMALALAHALELPGKMRLAKDQYVAIQAIYYPGFTIGGIAEPISLLLVLILIFTMPVGSAAFSLTAVAFVALLAMHAAYWLLTHPVNDFWLKDVRPKGFGERFFAFDPLRRSMGSGSAEWTVLRNRWEYSHLVRAGLGLVGLISLVSAVTV